MSRYICPICGSDRLYTKYSKEVKTKYRLCCERCKYSRKLTREEVENLPEAKYGLWNGMSKRFVGGIREKGVKAVEREARKKGFNLYLWRYEIRHIPLNQLIEESKK